MRDTRLTVNYTLSGITSVMFLRVLIQLSTFKFEMENIPLQAQKTASFDSIRFNERLAKCRKFWKSFSCELEI